MTPEDEQAIYRALLSVIDLCKAINRSVDALAKVVNLNDQRLDALGDLAETLTVLVGVNTEGGERS